eukprot:3786094-Prymnesium_polylepis.1
MSNLLVSEGYSAQRARLKRADGRPYLAVLSRRAGEADVHARFTPAHWTSSVHRHRWCVSRRPRPECIVAHMLLSAPWVLVCALVE